MTTGDGDTASAIQESTAVSVQQLSAELLGDDQTPEIILVDYAGPRVWALYCDGQRGSDEINCLGSRDIKRRPGKVDEFLIHASRFRQSVQKTV